MNDGKWVTKYSSRGLPHRVWQTAMPWIDPSFLDCSVYLYPSEAEAENGDAIGGSGFLIGIELGKKKGDPVLECVVTNKHVIDAGNMVVRTNTIFGQKDIIPLDGVHWFTHPEGDDLAVCPIQLSALHRRRFIKHRMFLTKKLIEDWEIGPGDDVFVIGRFINHEGRQRNLPSIRFGNIAQMPWEPIVVDGHPQESFLIEARSISGYSGAPVFVHCPAPVQFNMHPDFKKAVKDGKIRLYGVSDKRIDVPIPMGPWLMGVDYCHIRWDEPVWSTVTQRPVNDDWFVKSNTGMMGVVPAWRLEDILAGVEMKPLIDDLKEEVTKGKKPASKVELDAAALSKAARPAARETERAAEGPEGNPAHKEDFTRLLNVAAKKREQED